MNNIEGQYSPKTKKHVNERLITFKLPFCFMQLKKTFNFINVCTIFNDLMKKCKQNQIRNILKYVQSEL